MVSSFCCGLVACLFKSTLVSEAVVLTVARNTAHDDVINNWDVERPACFQKLFGDIFIRAARRGVAAWVIVSDDDAGRAVQDGPLNNLPWVNLGLIYDSRRDAVDPQWFKPCIQTQHNKLLSRRTLEELLDQNSRLP